MNLISPNRGYPLERLEGDVGSMTYWCGAFDRVGRMLGDLRVAAQTAQELPGEGSSIRAARADAVTVGAALAADIAEAELLSGVLQRYADSFEVSADRANALIGDIEDAHARWQAAKGSADEAGLRALSVSRSGDDAQVAEANDEARDALSAQNSAKDALDELWLDYERYYGQWDDAYDTALSELAGGTGVPLTSDARDLLDELLAADHPSDVLRLWEEHPELHDELLRQHPEILGNLDGIPYADRHRANWASLTELHGSDLDEPLRTEVDALWNELSRHPSMLLAFDPYGSGQLTAAVLYGDIDSATDVNVLISGMNTSVSDLAAFARSARALNADVDAQLGAGSSATIAWFGYDTPTIPEEPFMGRAEDGAAALRSFLLGLDTSVPSAEIAVIAHSYGSTTAALAIGSQPDGLGVDQFIAAGSAGFPSDERILENLQHGPEMFATLSDGDMWARIGRDTSWGGAHGTVPETLPGVTEFGSDGGYQLNADGSFAAEDDHGGEYLESTPGHASHAGGNSLPWDGDDQNGYLSHGTESFYNIGQIVATGEPGTQMDAVGSGGGLWDLPDWLPFNRYRF